MIELEEHLEYQIGEMNLAINALLQKPRTVTEGDEAWIQRLEVVSKLVSARNGTVSLARTQAREKKSHSGGRKATR